MRFYPFYIHCAYSTSESTVTALLIFYFLFRDFNASEEHSFEELSSILDLSTRWGFTSIRELAIRHLNPPTPYQRLILGRKCAVDQWIPLALQELCERPQPLTGDEARLMDFEDVVLIGSVRENVRKRTLTVNSAEIRDCIEARRNGEPWEQLGSAPDPLRPLRSVTASFEPQPVSVDHPTDSQGGSTPLGWGFGRR